MLRKLAILGALTGSMALMTQPASAWTRYWHHPVGHVWVGGYAGPAYYGSAYYGPAYHHYHYWGWRHRHW